jgi:hypothetical protein
MAFLIRERQPFKPVSGEVFCEALAKDRARYWASGGCECRRRSDHRKPEAVRQENH